MRAFERIATDTISRFVHICTAKVNKCARKGSVEVVDRLGKLPSKEQQLSRTQHFILRAHAAILIQYNTAHAEHR